MLINQKRLADGSVLKKIERFSKQGVERYFCKDDEKIVEVNSRLNRDNNAQNWLSMRPDTSNYFKDFSTGTYFGELNENNKPHGRGICIWNDGRIWIGYCENGLGPGHYIHIDSDGGCYVGEHYIKDGVKRSRGTYYLGGTYEKQYDD